VVEKTTLGGHDIVVRTQHEAPSGPNGEVLHDPFKAMDLENAKWMMEVLKKHYAGIPWRCVYDGAQKMAYFSIPILMGVNKFWAINLVTDQMTEPLLTRAGGELLERYGQSRTRFNLNSFLDAREKHSALVVPSRKVPG
jgi:hypothetical protein